MKAPCFNCENRVAPTKDSNGCRSTCEIWKEYETYTKIKYAEPKRTGIGGYNIDKTRKLSKKYNPNRYGK